MQKAVANFYVQILVKIPDFYKVILLFYLLHCIMQRSNLPQSSRHLLTDYFSVFPIGLKSAAVFA